MCGILAFFSSFDMLHLYVACLVSHRIDDAIVDTFDGEPVCPEQCFFSSVTSQQRSKDCGLWWEILEANSLTC